ALRPGKDEGVEVAPGRARGEARSSLRGKLSGGSHPPAWTTGRLAGQALISFDYRSQPDPCRVLQTCHRIAEPGGHRRTPKDTTTSAMEYRRTRKDPPGYRRTHRRVGSGPSGPGLKSRAPTNFVPTRTVRQPSSDVMKST